MKHLFHALSVLVPLIALDGCASGPTPAPSARIRRRRPRPTVAVAPTPGTPSPTDPTAPAPVPAANPANAPSAPEGPAAPSPARPAIGVIAARPAPTVVANAFGTPVVTRPAGTTALTPRWARDGRRYVLRCDGEVPPHLPESQSPAEPTNASVVRTFHPAERAVAACSPPSTPNGRLPVRATFHGSGAPQEFSFPQMSLSEAQALCVGRSLCDLRLPVFRSINAQVNYDYVVYLLASE